MPGMVFAAILIRRQRGVCCAHRRHPGRHWGVKTDIYRIAGHGVLQRGDNEQSKNYHSAIHEAKSTARPRGGREARARSWCGACPSPRSLPSGARTLFIPSPLCRPNSRNSAAGQSRRYYRSCAAPASRSYRIAPWDADFWRYASASATISQPVIGGRVIRVSRARISPGTRPP